MTGAPATTSARAPSGPALATLSSAAEAYVWGYPLVVMHRTRKLLCSRTAQGAMNVRDQLATAADRAVVAPNNDTLYSSGWFDLRAGDLTVDVPAMDSPHRYWSVMLLDAYTQVAYVCRRLHGTDGVTVRVTLDPSTEPSRDGGEVITMATPTVWALVRVLLDGEDDLDACRQAQRSITIIAPSGHPDGLLKPGGPPNKVHEAGAAFFDELRAAVALDPPADWHPPPSPEAWAIITGQTSLPDVELAAAIEAGEAAMRANGFGADAHGNGWGTKFRGTDFGDNVLSRASMAKFGLAGHHPIENRSYTRGTADAGAPLDGSVARSLRFPPGGEPPCDGFWSLTLYQADMFFFDNDLDRYAIGDRTAGLVRDVDGGLTITIGGPRPGDVSNWLPAPDGRYLLGLRVYEGHAEVVDATWFPPALEVHAHADHA